MTAPSSAPQSSSFGVLLTIPCNLTSIEWDHDEDADTIFRVQQEARLRLHNGLNPGTLLASAVVGITTLYRFPRAGGIQVLSGPLEFSVENGIVIPPSHKFLFGNNGGDVLNFTATAKTTSGEAWLTVAPSSSTLAASSFADLTVTVNTNLTHGRTNEGTIRIAGNASNSPQTVPVKLILPAEDELAIAVSEPPPGATLTEGTTTNFFGTATFKLLSRSSADLALRVFDQDTNLLASSPFIRVKRADRSVSTNLIVANVVLSAVLPGKPLTNVIVKTVLIDPVLSTVFLERSVRYTVATVELVGLEVSQFIQDWNKSVTLFTEKPKLVRAHLRATENDPIRVKTRNCTACEHSEFSHVREDRRPDLSDARADGLRRRRPNLRRESVFRA
ncbi:MAG: hypothetical protein EXS36_07600 [Pedosphaera sp.]|nr:hypothetical protein [Pedosphaera sp.]